MISENEIEKALDYLRYTSEDASKAKAEFGYVSEYRKVIKAQIMREHDCHPLGKQEALAYSDERYIRHLKAIKEAEEQMHYLMFMRNAAEIKIEAWRTQCSNERVRI